jgi:antitoxin CcdA
MTLDDYKARERLSLAALAARIGRPVSTVHGWLSGARRPDWAGLEAIAAATGGAVTAADFQGLSASREGFAETQAPFAIEARALGLDPDAIAREALAEAIRAEKARRWQHDNREAIEAHNRWVEEHGLPLAKYRMF